MSKSGHLASSATSVHRALHEVGRRLDGNLRPLQQEAFNRLRSDIRMLLEDAADVIGLEVDELLHNNYDCGVAPCTNETCKSNPNGKCEHCGTPRREGQHYSTEVWNYLCERTPS